MEFLTNTGNNINIIFETSETEAEAEAEEGDCLSDDAHAHESAEFLNVAFLLAHKRFAYLTI